MGILLIGFGIIAESKLCGNTSLWYLHILFNKIIFTDETHFCDFWSLNYITTGKKLMLGYKQVSCDCMTETSPPLSNLLHKFSTNWSQVVKLQFLL